MVTGNNSGLQTTETSLEIIRALERMDGAGVSQMADELNIAPSTAHTHLKTLENNEFLIQEGDVYYLSLEFLRLGEYTRLRRKPYKVIREKVKQLAEETGDRTLFTVEEHGQGVYLSASSGKNAIQTYSNVGKRVFLHVSAAGKSILAFFADNRVDEIIDKHGLPQKTENTITDREELFDELEWVQRRGYALNKGEHIEGVNAIAAPVTDPSGQVIGGLSVSGPVHRMQGPRFEEELPTIVSGIADEIELELKYS